MKSFQRVEEFTLASRRVTTDGELKGLLEGVCDDLGFHHFALVHHADGRGLNEIILIHNYPQEWVEYFEKNNLFARDPVLRATHTTSMGFAWSRVPEMVRFTSEDADIFARARKAGIGEGFTVPAHIPGESNGSCSFATTPSRILGPDQLPVAQILGSFAFEAARRLAFARTLSGDHQRPLTERQRECVILVAQGKTDWEISRILGVSQETVIEHLKAAREKYGVSKRTMLTVRALYDGSISFSEILRRHPHFLV